MTLFRHSTGPMMKYVGGVLYIDDLNPESHLAWRMTRWEMFRTGLQFLVASGWRI